MAAATVNAMREEDLLTNVENRGSDLRAGLESLRRAHRCVKDAFQRTGVILRGDDRGATMLMVSPPG